MNKKKLIFYFIFIVVLSHLAYATTLTCNMTSASSCSSLKILYLQNDSGGYDNAHAENVSQATYNNVICCSGGLQAETLSIGCDDATFLKLENVSNTHVELPTGSTYSVKACLSAEIDNISCYYPTTSCNSNETCIATIASSQGDNTTNAHVASCDYYEQRICCYFSNVAPTVASATISPTSPNKYNNLTCANGSVSDENNEQIFLNYNWFKHDQSLSVLNLPFDGDVNDFSGYGNDGTLSYVSYSSTADIDVTNSTQCIDDDTLTSIDDYYKGWTLRATSGDADGNEVKIASYDYVNTTYRKLVFETELIGFQKGDSYYLFYDEEPPTWTSSGKIGGAFVFDGGDDYISCGNDGSVSGAFDAITVEAWFKTETVDAIGRWIVGDMNSIAGYRMRVTNNILYALLRYNNTEFPSTLSKSGVADGNWHHAAFTYNKTAENFTLYLDGEPVDSTTWDKTINSGGDLEIGRVVNFAGHFNGTIDEVRIYNYTLTSEQIQAHYALEYNITVSQETSVNDQWNCSITPIDYRGLNGTTIYSSAVTIGNTAPPKVSLYWPEDGNTSVTNRTPTFEWSNVTEVDGDPITYLIEIDDTSSFASPEVNETSIAETANTTKYTPTTNLQNLDQPYYWHVRAYDGTDYGEWSDTWNFTIKSTVIISLPNNTVDFGYMVINETKNTTNNNPYPIVVRNDGNTLADINISLSSGDTGLWESPNYYAPTTYFQYKIDNQTGEEGAFNWSASITFWLPVDVANISNKIKDLNYTDQIDEAEIDILVTVPPDEPAGAKSSSLIITGAIAS